MALSIEQIAIKVEALRSRATERDARAERVLLTRQGKITQVFPDFLPPDVDVSVVANFVDIVARDLSEVMAPLPTINCSAANMTDDKARKFADKRTRIASNYLVHSDISAHMYTFADRYITYGFAAFIVEIDKEESLPRIRVEDSYMSYPEFDRYGRCVSFSRRYTATLGELIAQYPEHEVVLRGKGNGSQSQPPNTPVDIIRYYDKDQSVIYVPTRQNLVVSQAKNPIGKMMVVVAKRPSIDDEMRGQFDDVLGIQILRNRFAMLALEVLEKAIAAPTVLPLDVQDLQFGADAIIRTNNPAGVHKVEIPIPQGAFAQTALLNQEMQTGARYPQSRTGNVDASVITGQGVQALMGAFDTQVKSFHAIVATTLRDVIKVCFMVDEKVHNKTKTIRGVDAGSPYAIEYLPKKDIDGDYSVDIAYGMLAGLNPAQGLVFILQARQGKFISKDRSMRELPFNVDVSNEQEKIEIEDMREALIGSISQLTLAIPQMVSQGADPSELIRKVAQTIQARRKGEAIEDTMEKLFAPPPPPEATAPGQQDMGGGMPPEMSGAPQPDITGQGGGVQIPTPPAGPPDAMSLIASLNQNGAARSTVNTRQQR